MLILTSFTLLLATGLVASHPRSSCMNQLMVEVQKMGQMMMEQQEKEMKNMKLACLDARPPMDSRMKKFHENMMECFFIEGSPYALRTFIKRDVPDKSEVGEMMANAMSCALNYDTIGLHNIDGSLNFDVFNDLWAQPWEGKDGQLVQAIAMTCIDMQRQRIDIAEDEEKEMAAPNELQAEDSLALFAICHQSRIIEECNGRGEESGMAPSLMITMKSLMFEGECFSVEVPKEVEESYLHCDNVAFNKTTEAYIQLLMAAMMGVNMSPRNSMMDTSNMMETMTTIGKVMEQLLWTYEQSFMMCNFKRLDILENDNKTFVRDKFLNKLFTMKGWEGIEDKRARLMEEYDSCFAGIMEDGKMDLSDIETVQVVEFITRNCLLPRYINICGANNDLTDFINPMFSRAYLQKIVNDVLDTVESTMKSMKPPNKRM